MATDTEHRVTQAILDLIERERASRPDIRPKEVLDTLVKQWFGSDSWGRTRFILWILSHSLLNHWVEAWRVVKDYLGFHK